MRQITEEIIILHSAIRQWGNDLRSDSKIKFPIAFKTMVIEVKCILKEELKNSQSFISIDHERFLTLSLVNKPIDLNGFTSPNLKGLVKWIAFGF